MNFMGFETQDFTEINGKVWLYKNFLSYDECKNEIKKVNSGNVNKITDNGVKEINFDNKFIKYKLTKLMKKDAYIGNIMAYDTPINKFWALHTDLEGETNKNYNKHWGIVGYLNDFEGGELLFPDYGIVIKPEKGDLVIHHASNSHSVALTKSDQRLTYTSEIYKINTDLSQGERQKAIDFLVN